MMHTLNTTPVIPHKLRMTLKKLSDKEKNQVFFPTIDVSPSKKRHRKTNICIFKGLIKAVEKQPSISLQRSSYFPETKDQAPKKLWRPKKKSRLTHSNRTQKKKPPK